MRKKSLLGGLRFAICIAAGMALTTLCRAGDLKSVYSGSSMATDSSSRVITLEFSKDGTGLYEEHSAKGDIKSRVHWFRDGKKVTVDIEPIAGKPPLGPLVFEVKRTSLVIAGTENAQLGVLGFPVLHPFGPANVGNSSGMSTCVTGAPGPCAMRENWSSSQPSK